MTDHPAGICSNCGSAVPAGAATCPTCGTPVAGPGGQTPPASPGGPAPAGSEPTGPPAMPGPGSQDSRNWALGAHASALAGAFIGGVGSWVGPLIIWLIRKDTDPFVAEHAREALNFNITVAIAIVVAFLLTVLTLGLGALLVIPAGLVLGVFWLIWTIQAMMAASRGETYRYPLTLRLIS